MCSSSSLRLALQAPCTVIRDHIQSCLNGVRESVNKSAGSAASPDYVKFQAVIKSAASAASPRGGLAISRLDHGLVFVIFGHASG